MDRIIISLVDSTFHSLETKVAATTQITLKALKSASHDDQQRTSELFVKLLSSNNEHGRLCGMPNSCLYLDVCVPSFVKVFLLTWVAMCCPSSLSGKAALDCIISKSPSTGLSVLDVRWVTSILQYGMPWAEALGVLHSWLPMLMSLDKCVAIAKDRFAPRVCLPTHMLCRFHV